MRRVYFISHPDVVIDPAVPVPQWSLSDRGRERMHEMLSQPWVSSVGAVYCSTEQKAIDGAEILAHHLSLPYETVEALGENDRSATGYLPRDEFTAVVDQFFAHPDESVRGWETARHAQQRIVQAVETVVAHDRRPGHIAIVSHGGVGTLYLCHLKGRAISREEGQVCTTGGCYYCFDPESKVLLHGWRPIDELGESA